MQHFIILPGNSPRNREWGAACVEYFAPQFDSVWMAEYAHWEAGEKWIDLPAEEVALRAHVAQLPAGTRMYVFSKSIGSILAVNAIHHGVLVPAGCAFFGMPLDHAVPEVWQGGQGPLASLAAPTIAFHNDADPTTSYEFTSATLAAHAPQVTLVTTQDNTHDYLDFAHYEPLLVQSLAL